MIENLKTMLGKTSITPLSWLVGLSGIMMVRFFLEALSSPTSTGIIASDASTLIHYYMFFLGVALSTLIFLHVAIPSWRHVLPQFVSLAFIMILFAPIIDLVVSTGEGFTMTYLFEKPRELLHSFLTFFGPDWKQGITLGIRIELALIILFTSFLIYQIRRNLLKTLGFAILLYMIVFAFGALPSLISIGQADIMSFLGTSIVASATFTNNLHSSLLYSSAGRALEIGFNFLLAKILFLICLVLTATYFYLSHKEKFLAVLKNSRPERVLAYFSVIFFGMFLAFIIAPPVAFAWNDYISILVLLFAFYFSWVFAVCTNDIADEKIDLVSAPNNARPLVQKILSHEDLRQAASLSLIASLLAAFLSGYYAFFCVLAFTALYYIYSMPPTRFKQIPFLASFLIGLCKLSAILSGFFFISSSKVLSTFPTSALFGIPIFFTLFVGLRDLKDIEGDSANGISTPATIFGPKFIGLSVALAYLLVPLFLNIFYLYILTLPAALLSYYFCIQPNYRERPLFLIYFAFYLTLISGAIFLSNLFV